MSKVLGIQEANFFKLVERMNKFNENNKVFATQVFPIESENLWYALIYYESNNRQGKKLFGEATSFQKTTSSPIPKLATEPQIKTLKKLGYKEDTSKLTKSEAFKILNQMLPKKR